jgi:hypothetical protein
MTDTEFHSVTPGVCNHPLARCSWQQFHNEDDTWVTALVPPGVAPIVDLFDALEAQGVDQVEIERFASWWLK